MEYTIFIIFSFVSAINAAAFTPPPCPYLPSNLCNGKATGNYELIINGYLYPNHFLQCVHGIEYCQPCAYNNPLLIYSKYCDQCLFPGYYDNKLCQKPQTDGCPTDIAANHAHCQKKSSKFSGNRYNYLNPVSSTFLACWEGQFVECLKCPAGLVFKDGVDWQGQPYVYGHCGYP